MSVYICPNGCLAADTEYELAEMTVRLDYLAGPRKRAIATTLGAIQLSTREFHEKLIEIERFGRGFGPKLAQIRR